MSTASEFDRRAFALEKALQIEFGSDTPEAPKVVKNAETFLAFLDPKEDVQTPGKPGICENCGKLFDMTKDTYVTFNERKMPSHDFCSLECVGEYLQDDE